MTKHLHLRELPSVTLGTPHRVTPEFRRFAIETLIEPLDLLRGYKQDEKEKAVLAIISTLLLAGQRFKTVADSRDPHQPGVSIRVPIWDALVRARYAKRCTGSEVSRMVTRYYATTRLHNLFTDWTLGDTIEQHYNKGSAMEPDRYNLIVVKPSKRERHEVTGKPLTKAERWERLKPIPKVFSEMVETDEDILNYINQQNLQHSWFATGIDDRGHKIAIQPGVTLQQQHVGEFGNWSRLYTHGEWGAQNLRKEVRKTMRIDGGPTASLDFKCSIPRLLYHCVGIDPDVRDLYQPYKIFPRVWETATDPFVLRAARDIAKKLTIISINARSPIAAQKALVKFIAESESEYYQAVIENEGVPIDTLAKRFDRLHRHAIDLMTDLLDLPNIGEQLMSLESSIMLTICLVLASEGRPVLPIHDELIVKTTDVEFVEHTMIKLYRESTGFAPVIECEVHEF